MLYNYIFLGIAVFGFTYLLRYLDGPFDILKRFRMFMGIKYLPSYETNDLALTMEVSDDVEEIPKDKPLARLVGCFWCLTTWISILFCVIYEILYSREIFETFAGIFICTGISGFLNEKLH